MSAGNNKRDVRSKKICISLSPDIAKKINGMLEKQMKATGKNYPFSTAISDIVEEYFKK